MSHLTLYILLAAIAIVLKMDIMSIFYCAVLVILFIYFCANMGLVLNLRFPNLNWTNETMAVKQGAAVVLALFGNWALLLILTGCVFWRTNQRKLIIQGG